LLSMPVKHERACYAIGHTYPSAPPPPRVFLIGMGRRAGRRAGQAQPRLRNGRTEPRGGGAPEGQPSSPRRSPALSQGGRRGSLRQAPPSPRSAGRAATPGRPRTPPGRSYVGPEAAGCRARPPRARTSLVGSSPNCSPKALHAHRRPPLIFAQVPQITGSSCRAPQELSSTSQHQPGDRPSHMG